MVEAFNTLILSLSLLFGYEIPILSEQSIVTVNEKEQTIEIFYENLYVLKDYAENKLELKNAIDSISQINERYNNLEVISIKKLVKKNKTNITVKLRYNSHETLKKYFGINLSDNLIFVHHANKVSLGNKTFNTKSETGEVFNFKENMEMNYVFTYKLQTKEFPIELEKL